MDVVGDAKISGIVTASSFVGNGDFVELDVDGQTNLDDVNIVGIATVAGNFIPATTNTYDLGRGAPFSDVRRWKTLHVQNISVVGGITTTSTLHVADIGRGTNNADVNIITEGTGKFTVHRDSELRDVYPETDSAHDLGKPSVRWSGFYADTAFITGNVYINRTSALAQAKLSITKDADQEGIGIQLNQSSGITTSFTTFNSSGTQTFSLAHDTDSTPDLIFKLKPASSGLTEKLRITSEGEVRIANGGLLTIKTDAAATYGISEAFRIDDSNATNDRPFQIFEYQHNGARSFSFNQNLNVTTTGSSYTYTQGNYGGSNMIQMNQGELRIYNDPSIVSGGTSAITPTERVTILGNGRIGINDSTPNDYEVDIMKRSTATDAQIRLYNNATGSSNDTIMRFQIGGTSAGNYIYFGDSADTNVGMIRYSHSDDSLRFTVNTEERLHIDSSGNVGIGTNNPTRGPLHIHQNSTGDCQIHLTNQETGVTSTDGFTIFAGGDAGPDCGFVNRESAGDFEFYTHNGTSVGERLRITSAGKLIVKGEDDQDNLSVTANNNTEFAVHQDDTDGEVSLRAQDPSGSNNAKYMTFFTQESGSAAAERLRIDSDGDLIHTATNKTLSLVSTQNAVNAGTKIAFFGANRYTTDQEFASIKGLLKNNSGGSGKQKGHLLFTVGSNSHQHIMDDDGKVGINTTNPCLLYTSPSPRD